MSSARRTFLRMVLAGAQCCAWLVTLAPRANAAPASEALGPLDAVNLAGRQRMLSQRATKAYLMLGQGIAPARARALLAESIEQFDTQLAELAALPANAALDSARSSLAAHWHEMQTVLGAPPDVSGAQTLYDVNEAVQKAAHQLTLACEARAPAPYAHLLNLAGRQRMLSQRMAKFFLYRTWGVNGDAADMELELSHAHFNAVLIQLETSPLLDPAAHAAVAEVRGSWHDYEKLLGARDSLATMRGHAEALAMASETVLAACERVVTAVLRHALQAG